MFTRKATISKFCIVRAASLISSFRALSLKGLIRSQCNTINVCKSISSAMWQNCGDVGICHCPREYCWGNSLHRLHSLTLDYGMTRKREDVFRNIEKEAVDQRSHMRRCSCCSCSDGQTFPITEECSGITWSANINCDQEVCIHVEPSSPSITMRGVRMTRNSFCIRNLGSTKKYSTLT